MFASLISLFTAWPGFILGPLMALPLLTLAFPAQAKRPAKTISGLIDRLSGAALGMSIGFALLIILIQLAAVLLRYVFGLSFSWLNDSVIFSFAALFMLGAAATLRDDGHVRVDILRPRFGPRTIAAIEMIGALVLIFPICWLILLASGTMVVNSWAILEPFNESDGLPVKYLFKTLVPAFAGLLALQGLSQALKAALMIRGQVAITGETSSGQTGAM